MASTGTARMNLIAEGTTIAHYRVLELLGAGGFGAVYKAFDERLARLVAVKVLPPEALVVEERRRRFLQEARAASALNHPHILTVYEFGEADGRLFLAMEFVHGETLRARLNKSPLPFNEAIDLALQGAAGLSKAHEHGIVHRDIKPENLMVTADGYIKILDFGLAKLVERERVFVGSADQTILQVKTGSGAILGTVNYMSPEQLLGKRVDRRCDIFSFGIVLYEMLAGYSPFARDNAIDTMHAILHETPPPPHAVKSSLPRGLAEIINRALAKAPKDRYAEVRHLANDLKRLKRDLEAGRDPSRPRTKLVLKPVASIPRPPRIDYEKELNETQYRAVTTTEGPLLVVAGAGTGKTRTLVYRVARLIETGAQPESVLLLTFTRRAAASMLSRAAQLADERCQRVAGGTFHALANQTLRKHAELTGVARGFTVLDQGDTEDLIDMVRRQMGLTGRGRHFPRKRTIAAIFSMAANKLLSIEEVLRQSYPQFIDDVEALEELHRAFEAYKRERHLLGYDDLLTRLRDALEASELLRFRLSEQYRYIMVDEYQDTNRLQAQIVRLMAATHDNVAVVGDEAQAIYSFRGASFRNMLEFPELFPKAEVIKLEENFRSTQPILDVANTVIAAAPEGYAKRLFSRARDGVPPVLVAAGDENEQSRFVAQRILELREEGVPLHEIAVLFRASSHSFDLEIELGRHAIPYRKFGGIRFAESAHIKDVLCFLRAATNPGDVIAWLRVLKMIDHIGDATAEQIVAHLNVEGRSFRTAKAREQVLKRLKEYPARASYADGLARMANLLLSLVAEKQPGAQLAAVCRYYRPILRARYDDYPRRQRDLEHLLQIAKRYKTAEEFLADVALDPAELAAQEGGRGQGMVTLSTAHSAKGLEWDAVFVIWMMEGWFPSTRAYDEFEDLEEERRLLYVAATRARRYLYFTYPAFAYDRRSSHFAGVSRFLDAVPESTLPRATLAED